jgi:hypothetical protein
MSPSSHFRAHGRRDVNLSAALEPGTPEAAGERGTRVRIVNLSLGGACIEVGEPVPLGTSLTLEIVAPTLWDPLVLRGRVVWSRGDRGAAPRAGISFEHSDPARAFALFELLGAHEYDA